LTDPQNSFTLKLGIKSSNTFIIRDPITPQTCHYTTLWNSWYFSDTVFVPLYFLSSRCRQSAYLLQCWWAAVCYLLA